MALLSVLNRKCGRMRDCSSASRACVSAGVWPRARSTRAATSRAASSPPDMALASQGALLPPASCSMAQAYSPAAMPSSTPAAYCPVDGRRCSGCLSRQAATSQTRVPGRLAPVSRAMFSSHCRGESAPNIAAVAATACTKSTARSTTPTLQASKTSAAGRGGGAAEVDGWGGKGRVMGCCGENAAEFVGRSSEIGGNGRKWAQWLRAACPDYGHAGPACTAAGRPLHGRGAAQVRSEEHTSELQSQSNLVCRLLLEKKKNK